MLGASPGSPFRSGSGHRAPWPPPTLPTAQPDAFGRYGVSSGLYSLFPGATSETSAAIYSQATSTSTRFHAANTFHSFIGSHKVADSLFSTNYSFGGPTPPPAPGPFSPAGPLVERGLAGLELMAKGFNAVNNNNNNNSTNNNNNTNASPSPGGRKSRGRWERTEVKTEGRPSCGCRRQQQQQQQPLPPTPQPATGPAADEDRRASGQTEGCSRTTWPPPIKKEPGATPCQVAEVTTSISPLATVKLEASSPAPPSCKKDSGSAAAIPVGIAVARQRLQQEHKALAGPGPPPAPQPPPPTSAPEQGNGLSTMAVLQAPPCDERTANGVGPWAAPVTHNSALTPPSLWQYPAPVPVQLGPADHGPLPPVGYQLVRDPLTGHLLLIPAANIETPEYLWNGLVNLKADCVIAEHLQRAVLWPGYPTLQPSSLHMGSQPAATAQHIQLFEPSEPADLLCGQGETTRILVQPQFALAETPAKRKATVIKVEAADVDMKASTLSRPADVTVASNPAPAVFPATTATNGVAHFFYEHPTTAVVQLAQAPQPSASVQTDNGKRSQATSPVNPAETCLTPPPEVTVGSQSETEEQMGTINPEESSQQPVQVQDASNQTDTPPSSEDETVPAASASSSLTPQPPVDLSGLELLSNSIEQFENHCTAEISLDAKVEISTETKQEPVPPAEKVAEILHLFSKGSSDGNEKTNNSQSVTVVTKTEKQDIPVKVNSNNMLGGLGLLCALAEQRFMEEVSKVPSEKDVNNREVSPSDTNLSQRLSTDSSSSTNSSVDVNRNYKTPKSERECKKFIANKVLQYFQHNQGTSNATGNGGSLSGSSSPQHLSPCIPVGPSELMDAMELNMRMQLAELQRRYKEKQRELSRLTPKKSEPSCPPAAATDSSSSTSSGSQGSPTKRGPGRPRKKIAKLESLTPITPPRPRVGRPPVLRVKELPPPVLEKVTDTKPRGRFESEDCAAPKLKATKLDILKPPTLTANRPKLKPATPVLIEAKNTKISPCNINMGKLGGQENKDLSSLKTNGDLNGRKFGSEELMTKSENIFCLDSNTSDKHSAFSLSRLPLAHIPCHTFGSKPLSRLPSPGETDVRTWFKPSEKLLILPKHQDRDFNTVQKEEPVQKPVVPPILSSSKKRKVGRPKKHLSNSGRSEATETIVAKKPKSKNGLMGFLLAHPRLDTTLASSTEANKTLNIPSSKNISALEHKPKIRPKLKAEAKVKTWSWGEDDDAEMDWRSEQSAVVPDNTAKLDSWNRKNEKAEKVIVKPVDSVNNTRKCKISSVDTKTTGKVTRKNNVSPPKITSKRSRSNDKLQPAKKLKQCNSNQSNSVTNSTNTASETEGEDLPLSVYSNKSVPASCLLSQTHLNNDKQRVLTAAGGLFYAGSLSAIRPPDVYGITLDGERGNRPHIYSREEVLKDAILEVKPSTTTELPPGTRLCAYWSQQYRCLYPGTVAEPSTPDPELDAQFVGVEFDDGDNGRINLDDIRLLPSDYPIVEYDPNPLLSLAKRKRRNSGTSCDSKDRRISSEAPNSTNGISNTSESGSKTTLENSSLSEKQISSMSAVISSDTHHTTDSSSHHSQNDHISAGSDSNNSSLRERRRLKKRRRDKLKRLLSSTAGALLAESVGLKKRRRKHRCCDEFCRHKRHHRRHRRKRHRHNRDSGSDSTSKSGHGSGDGISRLSPVLEQLDILEIKQSTNGKVSANEAGSTTVENVPSNVPVTNGGSANSEAEEEATPASKKTKKEKEAKPKKCRDRQPSVESRSKMAAFLPARQLWGWSGRGFKRPGKGRGRKEFFKAIQRGKESIMVGDCAVFLSTGRPDRPYIGRIESMWEAWGTNMVVRVKWFYHPEETTGCGPLKYPGALFESPHVDENDVQTISHKCEVLPLNEYTQRLGSEPHRYSMIYDNNDIYYLAGYYDPTSKELTMEPGVA